MWTGDPKAVGDAWLRQYTNEVYSPSGDHFSTLGIILRVRLAMVGCDLAKTGGGDLAATLIFKVVAQYPTRWLPPRSFSDDWGHPADQATFHHFSFSFLLLWWP